MKRTLSGSFLLLALSASSSFADIVTLKDGGQLVGFVEGTAREIRVKVGDTVQAVPIEQVRSIEFTAAELTSATIPPADAPLNPPPNPPPGPSVPAPLAAYTPARQEFTLPAGTVIAIRTIDAIDSKTSGLNHEYAASLQEALVVNGVTLAPARANAYLRVTELKQAGKLKGNALLSLNLVAVVINGEKVSLETGSTTSKGSAKGKRTLTGTGLGAGIGAGIGALSGGALGAGIGAATGGALGGTIAAMTGKSRVQIASETPLSFTLAQAVPVSIAESPAVFVTAAIARGEQLAAAHDFPGALREYQSALDANRASSLAHYRVGQVFLQQHDLSSAANEFRACSAGDHMPAWTNVWCHINLGQIFDSTNQRERALNEYMQAIRTADNTDSAQDRAAAYIKTPYRQEP